MNTDAELLSDLANARNLIEGQAGQGRKAGAGGAGEGRGAGAGEAGVGDWREERRVRLMESVANTNAALLGYVAWGRAGRAGGERYRLVPLPCTSTHTHPGYVVHTLVLQQPAHQRMSAVPCAQAGC